MPESDKDASNMQVCRTFCASSLLRLLLASLFYHFLASLYSLYLAGVEISRFVIIEFQYIYIAMAIIIHFVLGVKIMNADSAYIEPFLYDWVNHLQEIMKERKQEIINGKQFMPCEAITEIVVKAATYIAECLELDHHVKYMALELFDKFINEIYWDCYNRRKNDSDEWFQDYRKKSSIHSPFYLLSCFQVASKVNSHPNILKISQVLELAQVFVKNYEYTRDMVTSMEVEVLKKAGFRMPLYTPVYCIEILLAALKIHFESEKTTENREKLYDTSMVLLDLAYMQHEKLYHLFQSYFVCRSTQMSIQKKDQKLRILKSNAFLLSAAIVLCTGYILYPHSTLNNTRLRIIVSNLAKLVNATETEIIIMANALYQLVQYHISNNTDI